MNFRFIGRLAAGAAAIGTAYMLFLYMAGTSTDSDAVKWPHSQVVLTVFATPPAEVEDIATNAFTRHLEQRLNIRFQFVQVSAEAQRERKAALLAGGDGPDVFLTGNLTPDEQIRYGMQGKLRPLNALIDRYAPQIRRRFADNPQLKKSITAPDGNIYALPSVNECFHCWYSQKLWINAEWLERLGLTVPQTTDELYRVLQAFKLQDPNGNGKADEVPLTGAADGWRVDVTAFLMSAFIYYNGEDYFVIENGKVSLSAIRPEWRDGLSYIRRLFREGLIDPAAFTQTVDGMVQLARSPEANRIGSLTAGHIRMAFAGPAETRHQAYITVPPLTGPDGYSAAGYFNRGEYGQFAITNKASEEEAEAAIRLADYLYGEEAAVLNEFGPENLWWRRGAPGEQDEHGRPARYAVRPEFWEVSVQNEGWSQMGILYRSRDYRESWAVPDDPYSLAGYEHRLYTETKLHYEGREPAEVMPLHLFMEPEAAAEAERLRTSIHGAVRDATVAFITGHRRLETEWDAYVREIKELKADRFIELYQTAYDDYRAR
ncbi:sugar ABC transporter substrate-binding protein [Paenibacillus cisolokensis]|uniref:Sugar ABC transporter substrate-binding protein n=1 Tax=Paenibacillus cisolokensis TaxID=1658519 RepID=A0ABQ4N562_9BACL|nr:extracellular solute-binding protein [Paenibacillus cisolokensis]GIQ63291.1 sugar ABC transporter substrate-binding protein [Paenibacillus cisolokensis]